MRCTQAASCFSWHDIRDIAVYFHKGNYSQRITWNPAESLVCDVLRQLNVLHQTASCFSRYDIRDIAKYRMWRYLTGKSRLAGQSIDTTSTQMSLGRRSADITQLRTCSSRMKHDAAWCSTFSCLETSQTRDSAGFQVAEYYPAAHDRSRLSSESSGRRGLRGLLNLIFCLNPDWTSFDNYIHSPIINQSILFIATPVSFERSRSCSGVIIPLISSAHPSVSTPACSDVIIQMRPMCVGGVVVARSLRMSDVRGSNPGTAIGHAPLMSSNKSETRVQCFPLVWTHRNNYARIETRPFKREWCGYEQRYLSRKTPKLQPSNISQCCGYADDIALTFEDQSEAQALLDKLTTIIPSFGMRLAPSKWKVLLQNVPSANISLTIQGESLEIVENFTYLGSCISSNGSVSDEVSARISKARITLANSRHLWGQKGISLDLKGRV
ncbi:hypothetical protein T265_05517 [Opisthorchis viverrini]|uniref:Reverse transcriptase domain-containing protein n=1 Tax=Opisthorchis viverrini TaxID=6198 RepID=A0A074ZVK2_OPIVI|nr:hypothetical protein T265_05517 [Opisthorchis viverrini]KER27410.1 hypothetical protein T265_05517 [Opisthorchis viverrini]